MKKVLITGRTGYIARALVNTFESNHWITTSTSRCGNDSSLALDLCNSEAFDYSVLGPKDIVIHLAGVSSPDICRRDQARSLKINVEGTLTFLHRCIERGARVIFYSSDVVYGTTSNGVDEQAETQPVGLYGQMKRDVEIELVKSQKAKIVRLSYVFSRNDKFLQYLAQSDARNEAATIFHPFFRNVVHLLDVIEGTRSLCENWEQFPQNIFNFGGPELISRLDIAKLYQELVSSKVCLNIAEPNDSYFQERPRSICMNSPLLSTLLRKPATSIREAFRIEFDHIPTHT